MNAAAAGMKKALCSCFQCRGRDSRGTTSVLFKARALNLSGQMGWEFVLLLEREAPVRAYAAALPPSAGGCGMYSPERRMPLSSDGGSLVSARFQVTCSRLWPFCEPKLFRQFVRLSDIIAAARRSVKYKNTGIFGQFRANCMLSVRDASILNLPGQCDMMKPSINHKRG